MWSAVDLKHAGLIASAGLAVALRFFSDFGFSPIQHEAAVAGLNIGRLAPATYGVLVVTTLRYELQRDWFNLAAQAPPQIIGLLLVLLGSYTVLRRALGAEAAAATVLLLTPFAPLVAILGACAWVLLRTSPAA